MAYCEVSNVQRMIRWVTFTGTTVLTVPDITQLITEVDAKINGMLAGVYEVPVTDATDLGIMQYISVRLSAYEAAKILILQAGGQLPQIVDSWREDAENMLQSLLSGQLTLPNTETSSDRASAMYSHTAHDPDAPERQWSVDKDVDPW